jgi:hypothetical protein
MFDKPLIERLQQPLSVLAVWLSVTQPIFAEALSAPGNDHENDLSLHDGMEYDPSPHHPWLQPDELLLIFRRPSLLRVPAGYVNEPLPRQGLGRYA